MTNPGKRSPGFHVVTPYDDVRQTIEWLML